ncbi:MAG TPA: ParB/RepB/Spo0J family partition protein [Gemmatimonadales bacterium]|nr:ParB/RepB/Spo0J family partition protein [Gemmatimonadales bacterium]
MTAVAPFAGSLVELLLTALEPHPANRKQFDPAKLEELAASIRQVGVLTPLTVREHALGRYQILAGERRWRAAERAGLTSVPCIIRDVDDDTALELLLTENLQREDPNPLEEAEAYHAWLDRHPGQVKELAAKVGKSVTHVYSRLQLRSLSEEGKALVWSGWLPIAHAQLLARAGVEAQAEAVKRLANRREYGGVPDSLTALAEDLLKYTRELSRATFPTADADLVPAAGACTACPKRSGCTDGMFPELKEALVQLESNVGSGRKKLPPDTCLDGACWAEKQAAFIVRQRTTLRAKHGDALVELSARSGDVWPAKAGAPLPLGIWKKAAKGAVGAMPGLIVHRPDHRMNDELQLGAFLWVTVKPRPKSGAKPAAAAERPASRDYDQERAEQTAKGKIEMARRVAVAKAIMAKVPAKLDLDLVKAALAESFESWRLQYTSGLIGVPLPKAEKSDGELNRALALEMMHGEIDLYHAGSSEMKNIPMLAKRFGVDAKKVLAEHDATVKAAEPKEAAKGAPKKGAKK